MTGEPLMLLVSSSNVSPDLIMGSVTLREMNIQELLLKFCLNKQTSELLDHILFMVALEDLLWSTRSFATLDSSGEPEAKM